MVQKGILASNTGIISISRSAAPLLHFSKKKKKGETQYVWLTYGSH